MRIMFFCILHAKKERLHNARGQAPPGRQSASTEQDKSKPGNNATGVFQAAAIMPRRCAMYAGSQVSLAVLPSTRYEQ